MYPLKKREDDVLVKKLVTNLDIGIWAADTSQLPTCTAIRFVESYQSFLNQIFSFFMKKKY